MSGVQKAWQMEMSGVQKALTKALGENAIVLVINYY